MKIPYGTTSSYAYLVDAIGKPSAYRSIVTAIMANKIAIVIPSHRIINNNQNSHNDNFARKQWLINHEEQNK